MQMILKFTFPWVRIFIGKYFVDKTECRCNPANNGGCRKTTAYKWSLYVLLFLHAIALSQHSPGHPELVQAVFLTMAGLCWEPPKL